MKKYLIVAGILIILAGGFWLYSSLRSNSSINSSIGTSTENGFSFTKNGKTISAEYVSDPSKVDLGISIYPKAKLIDENQAVENLTIGSSKALAATYTTKDSRGKVESFYLDEIGSDAITVEAIDGSFTYKTIKPKTGIGSFVNVWVDHGATLFTIIKPTK